MTLAEIVETLEHQARLSHGKDAQTMATAAAQLRGVVAELDARYLARLQATAASGDPEGDHIAADYTVIELLREIGCTATADYFDAIEMWYA